jgi:sigma-B regulation protein RsbU (phosphoserine phosphatase)
MKILVVEDNAFDRLILESYLQNAGDTVILAENGQQAWDILRADREIYFVITDWIMPEMDGLELCRAVRQDPEIQRYVYIVVLTANEIDENAMIHSMEAGADDFLVKPLNPAQLCARLRAGRRVIELEIAQQRHFQALRRDYERVCQDLLTAAQIQRALLPPPGQRGRVEFAWLFYPSSFMAGDIFDFFDLDAEHVGFYMLDVVGHGISAALMSFSLYHQLSGQTGKTRFLLDSAGRPLPPSSVLQKLNENFQSPDLTQYFTMIYGYLHTPSGLLRLAQAGHPCPLWMRRDGRVESCGDGGLPIGMFARGDYQDIEFTMATGERLFIYSDGLDACGAKRGERFSEHCLQGVSAGQPSLSLAGLIRKLEQNMQTWQGPQVFDDDMTVLALELT